MIEKAITSERELQEAAQNGKEVVVEMRNNAC